MKPLTLSAHEVRAVLDGTKTQHWMRLKVQPPEWAANDKPGYSCLTPKGVIEFRGYWPGNDEEEGAYGCKFINLPHSPGDQIWVREAWRVANAYDDLKPSELGGEESVWYEADGTVCDWGGKGGIILGRYRQANHMPRWASRITLDVTGVRVCRVQDVTEVDAIACGSKPVLVPPDGGGWPHYEGFRELWIARHGLASWDANDWCEVIDFERRG